jgi:ABC-type multidrug transport system permease subunit
VSHTTTYEVSVTYPSWVDTLVVITVVWLLGVWYFKRQEPKGLISSPWWWAWAWPFVLLMLFFGFIVSELRRR